MPKFKVSRLTFDNIVFADVIEIDAANVTFYKGEIIGSDKTVVPQSNITSVYIDSNLLFANITDEIFGGMTLHATDFTKSGEKLSDRVLWGTDYPIPKFFHKDLDMKTYYHDLLSELQNSVSESDYEKITKNNFQKLFK